MHDPIVYQIYPKSFCDSDHDGMGDLKGVIGKLDYLASLGVDMIWLTPFYVSPQRDNGYDIADYLAVDPRFGTMADVQTLIAEAKQRSIGVMLDMVLNHTSTDHPWFQAALAGDQEKQAYYFFREEPVNWLSKFGGSAWQYVPSLNLYYLHLFDVSQADLNWQQPKVFEEITKIVNFWLDLGVAGLRFDVINLISKPEVFTDDPKGDGRRFYTDGPHVHEYLHALNRATFGQRPGVLTVGELSSTTIEHGVRYADPKRQELSTVFSFHHLKTDYKDNDKWQLMPNDLLRFKALLAQWQIAMQQHDAKMALFLNNHDQPRSISRFGDDVHYPYESATMLAGIMQLMRGIPYLFQGEEIGLPNASFTTIDAYRDVESLNYYALHPELSEAQRLKVLQARSRDNGRTPMIWDTQLPYGGFSDHEPWLSLTRHPGVRSVREQEQDGHSILAFYKKLIAFRKTHDIFTQGTIDFVLEDNPDLMAYHRRHDHDILLVIGNFSAKNVACSLIDDQALRVFGNYSEALVRGQLRPFELVVLQIRHA